MPHNPFWVRYPLKIQQLHFLGTQNLPLVEDSHHEILYEIVIPEMVISSHLPAYLLRQMEKFQFRHRPPPSRAAQKTNLG